MSAPTRILIATDFSPPARRAVELGGAIAAATGAEVLLLHVYSLPIAMVPETVVAISPGHLAELTQKRERALADTAASLTALGVKAVRSRVVEGVPWKEITRIAADDQADLIVVGTHGHGGLVHFLIGSVAERVVRTAGRPVLVAGGPPP
jgi:nucleotide-binding universal stress UspA family protein